MASTVFSLVRKGDVYRLSYLAKNEKTGLTDITAKVLNPAGASGTGIAWSGSDSTAGFVEGTNGWYYTDINTTALAEGAWHYIVDSASQKAPAATRIQVVDSSDLDDTVFADLMANVGTILSEVQSGTYGLSALNTRLGGIEGATFSTSTDSLEAIKDYLVDTIKTSIDGIKNNIACAVSVPEQVIIPGSSSITRRLYVTTYGESGEVNDPDSNEVFVLAYNPAGTDVTSSFFASATPTLTKAATGQYYIDMTVESTDTPTMLNLKFSYLENSASKVRWEDVSLLDAATDVTSSLNDIKGATFNTSTDSLEAIRNALDGYLAAGGTIESLVDDIESGITSLSGDVSGVKTVVDGIQLDLSNSTDGLGALKTLIDAIQTDLSNGTDGLGAIKTAVDGNNTLLTNATYGLAALKTLLDTIDGHVTNIDLSSIKGTGYDVDVDGLKAISDRVYAGGIAF